MKLSLHTKTVIETTITPPLFWRQGNEYRALLSDNDYREFCVIDEHVFFRMTSPRLNESNIETAFLEWEQISEEVFMDRYREVIQSLSLTPKLQS